MARTRQAAAAYNARRRRESLHDPAAGLFVTHRFVEGDTISSTSFPSYRTPITFAIDVRTDPAANGVIFEIGSTVGVGIAIDASNGWIVAAAGGRVAGDPGLTVRHSYDGKTDGSLRRFVLAVIPGAKLLNLWLNGKLIAAGTTDAVGDFLWADADDGGIGAVTRAPVNRLEMEDSLTDAVVVSPLRVFYNQRPRQMQFTGLGNDIGDQIWES